MHIVERYTRSSTYNIMLIIFIVLFVLILIRTAWISDDAAITLRSVLNFIHGFGPTFNIDERVQAYTHPLWFLILSFGSIVTGNVFYATFFISIITSVVAFTLLLRCFARNSYILVFLGVATVLSKAFIDFSTSGLENPLSHFILLIAVFCASSTIEKEKDRLIGFFLMCAALYLNRPDLLLMVFPLAIYVVLANIHKLRHLFISISIAATPLALWIAFSLFYYGFPFPNTAYAKLGTGIELNELVLQGFKYFLHAIDKDPVTVLLIVVGIMIGFFGSSLSKWLSAGVVLYVIYILSIGGDFMEGRFLTAPFFMSLIVLAREVELKASIFVFLIPVIILGEININPNILAGSSYSNVKVSANGIADERGYYYQTYGLLTASKSILASPLWAVTDRRVGIACGGLGFSSIMQGPGMHYIDECALADPLLSRLPSKENRHWRIGHFVRQLPTDYKESIEQGINLLPDNKTRAYWDSIRAVTRAPLFDKMRIIQIIKLNFGLVEKPDLELYRHGYIPRSTSVSVVFQGDIKAAFVEGASWNSPGHIIFDNALDIVLAHSQDVNLIDVSVDNNDVYEVLGLSNQEWHLLAIIKPVNKYDGLAHHKITLENTVRRVDRLRVIAKSGDGMYSVGHLLLK